MADHRAIMGSADGRDGEEEKPSIFPDQIIIDWVYRMQTYFIQTTLDWRQCGKSLALCYFAVGMELPDSLLMNCKSEFGVIFLRCSPT